MLKLDWKYLNCNWTHKGQRIYYEGFISVEYVFSFVDWTQNSVNIILIRFRLLFGLKFESSIFTQWLNILQVLTWCFKSCPRIWSVISGKLLKGRQVVCSLVEITEIQITRCIYLSTELFIVLCSSCLKHKLRS